MNQMLMEEMTKQELLQEIESIRPNLVFFRKNASKSSKQHLLGSLRVLQEEDTKLARRKEE